MWINQVTCFVYFREKSCVGFFFFFFPRDFLKGYAGVVNVPQT